MASIITTTKSGLKVEITPRGLAYLGAKLLEIQVRFDHPVHGISILISSEYSDVKGVATGWGYLGYSGVYGTDSFRGGRRVEASIGIAREDFDAAMLLAEAQVSSSIVESDWTFEEALRFCPPGFVPCRLKRTIDYGLACYETKDGVEIIDSDLLLNQRGWYWVDIAGSVANREIVLDLVANL